MQYTDNSNQVKGITDLTANSGRVQPSPIVMVAVKRRDSTRVLAGARDGR